MFSLFSIRLSVIIPFYNVERYISQCLESVYSQDIPESDYEVICVNDCSPDNSRNIVLEYQQQHDNLILIEHEENKKQGGARNTGLRAARGEYVWFIDSDDYIRPNCIKHLLDTLDENDLDLVLFDFGDVDENSHFLRRSTNDFPAYESCLGKNVFYYPEEGRGKSFADWQGWPKMIAPVWSRIVKRSLYLDNNIFHHEYFEFEDNAFGEKTYYYAKSIMYLPDVVIFYRQRADSAVHLAFHHNVGYWYAARIKDLIERYTFRILIPDPEIKILLAQQDAGDKFWIGFMTVLGFRNKDRQLFFCYLKKIDNLEVIFPYISLLTRFAITHETIMAILSNVVYFPRIVYRKLKKERKSKNDESSC
ncbi:hypothetical protein FACS1894182_06650 [Bacteroidia bacterium]|nr:hypothetical protein FACS1894182_06650 [Bacteroidia bacterium]